MNTNDEGDAREFIADLFEKNYRKIMSMVAKDPRCHFAAEDIVQETFCEAMRNITELQKHENPDGWLMEAAKYKMKALRKRLNIRGFHETEEANLQLQSLENEYGLVEIDMILDLAISVHEKTLFIMFYLEGYSARELAEKEGISEGAFRVRMLRIRDKIRKELKGKRGMRRQRE